MVVSGNGSDGSNQVAAASRPAAIVCDWDGVLSFAKERVDRSDCLRDVLQTAGDEVAGHGLDRKAVDDAVSAGAWREAIAAASRAVCPDDDRRRFRLALKLTQHYLLECFQRLERIYTNRGGDVLANSLLAELDSLITADCRLYICSGTMNDEITQEARLAGVTIADEVWGYPVRKLDVLQALANRLGCGRDRLVLLDDSVREVEAAREAGFAGIRVCNRQGNVVTDTLSQAFSAAITVSESEQATRIVQDFLGTDQFAIESVPKRFGSLPVWRVRAAGQGESPGFCKLIRMAKHDANLVGGWLAELYAASLPVATWLPGRDGFCIELASNLCTVMETGLRGKPLDHDSLDDSSVAQCARILAQLHRELRQRTAAGRGFRANFAEGLDAFVNRIADFWTLLAYAHHPFGLQAAARDGLRPWLRDWGEAIEGRLQRVGREVDLALAARPRQLVLGDFNCSNLLFDDSKLSGIVDYEDIHVGPIELDLLSFCMYGLHELHFPQKLDIFLRAYVSGGGEGPNAQMLAAVARGIANARLVRVAQRLAGTICLEHDQHLAEAEQRLNELNQLCLQLEDFDFSAVC